MAIKNILKTILNAVHIGFEPIISANRTKQLGLISLLFCTAFSGSINAGNPEKAVQWGRWQHTLISDGVNEDIQLTLEVVFTGPRGKTFMTPAFTDDGKTFQFRAAFPEHGVWRWKTFCSDPGNTGLHNKSGKAKVKRYVGENPLFRHGALKVSGNRRYLAHADGTPFLWMGDTGWNVSLKSTKKEWCDYVDKRTSQGFSVIQISPRGAGSDTNETIPFRQDGTNDPLFWKNIEDKIAYANDKGLMVFMVGLRPTWRDLSDKNPKNQKFETYLCGRFSSFMVILSPGLDQRYDEELNRVAVELQKSTLHLVTQHSGTNYESNLTFRNSPSVDFCGLQSGHHLWTKNLGNAYHAARSWTLDMWNGVPVKPVINIEAMYDDYGNNNAEHSATREKDARKLGWISWLSGSMGYTYGAGGIWKFNMDSTKYDFWRKVLDWPSANQMTVMRNFFESVEWWQLVPSHELVLNQAEGETHKMVVSGTKQKDLVLAYLPDNPEIVLDLKDFQGNMDGKWLNPVNGNNVRIVQTIIPSASVTFSRPDGFEDALLILTRQ